MIVSLMKSWNFIKCSPLKAVAIAIWMVIEPRWLPDAQEAASHMHLCSLIKQLLPRQVNISHVP